MTTVPIATDIPATDERDRRHKLIDAAQLLAYRLLFAHLGKFIIVAVYYIVTQWLQGQLVSARLFGQRVKFHLWNVKYTWDHLITRWFYHGGVVELVAQNTWDPMRHIVFRGVLEGVLGIVLFRQIGFNVEKYRAKLDGDINRFERVILRTRVIASPYQKGPVTVIQYLFLPVILFAVTVFVGVPLYLGVHAGLAHAAHWSWLEPSLSRHQSLVQRLYIGDYDGLIVGLLTGFLAGRTYRAYLYANTMNWARAWVAKGRDARWWMPWPTRHLIMELCAEGAARQREVLNMRSRGQAIFAVGGVALALILALYGIYIIEYIA